LITEFFLKRKTILIYLEIIILEISGGKYRSSKGKDLVSTKSTGFKINPAGDN
jgi:hypothetical protein